MTYLCLTCLLLRGEVCFSSGSAYAVTSSRVLHMCLKASVISVDNGLFSQQLWF